jgi:hypothetical protein
LWLARCLALYGDALISHVIDARFRLSCDWYTFLRRGRKSLLSLGLDEKQVAALSLSLLNRRANQASCLNTNALTNAAQFPAFAQAFEVLLPPGTFYIFLIFLFLEHYSYFFISDLVCLFSVHV